MDLEMEEQCHEEYTALFHSSQPLSTLVSLSPKSHKTTAFVG